MLKSVTIIRPRHQSCHTTPLQSPCTSPMISTKDMLFIRNNSTIATGSDLMTPTNKTTNGVNYGGGVGAENNALNMSSPFLMRNLNNISLNSSNNSSINAGSSSSGSSNSNQIRSRINSFKLSMFTNSKFNRRKIMSKEKQHFFLNNFHPIHSFILNFSKRQKNRATNRPAWTPNPGSSAGTFAKRISIAIR